MRKLNINHIIGRRADGANPFQIFESLVEADPVALMWAIRKMSYDRFLESAYWFAISHVAKSNAKMRFAPLQPTVRSRTIFFDRIMSDQNTPRHPAFDAEGYPTDETELAIKEWDFRDAAGWLAYIREAWNHHYGRMWEERGLLKMATGGWSGNESITHAMRENYILWAALWESSHRGGLEVLRMPKPISE